MLGPVEAELAAFAPKPRGLLAALLARANTEVAMPSLIDAVWPEDPPASAVRSVRIYLYRLRKDLGPRLCSGAYGWRLRIDADEWDAGRFQSLVRRGRAAAEAGRAQEGGELLRQALDLWRGPAFQGCDGLPLVREEAARLNELRHTVIEERLAIELDLGRHHKVVDELAALVAAHPYRERLRGQLMVAWYRLGRASDALAAFREGRRLMADELGVEPGPELRRLEHAILNDALPSPAAAAPEWRGGAIPAAPAALPPPPLTFVGREAELALLDGMTAGRGGPTVLAVSGPAGAGKTGLALHWAWRERGAFPDGQLYADLRACDDTTSPAEPGMVLDGFLRALGVRPHVIPPDTEHRSAMFRSLTRERGLLIILDDADSAAQVRPLLPGGGPSRVIVISRHILPALTALEEARAVHLGALTSGEARDLLVTMLNRTGRTLDTAAAGRVADLCDLLPLALRIAAARLSHRPSWTLAELADRLDGEGDRLNELDLGEIGVRGSLLASYRRLDHRQRAALRRFAIAARLDGVAPWLLAALLDVSQNEAEALAGDLADAQLLQYAGHDVTGARYRCHDLVRLFALERAEAEDPEPERRAARARGVAALLGVPRLEGRRAAAGRSPVLD
ncbi:BTAD domain-containing putative transcriptional regulator [Nonomuraea sp. B10E15]|uniref:AfsR/SARP family transcriptional regulator n=1 Tax=Nonomuraea sp. B10E15 TaxID=3153560 RepID=UPI00325CCA61